MDVLLLKFILCGCVLSISGHLLVDHHVDVENIFKDFDTLAKLTTAESEQATPSVCVVTFGEIKNVVQDSHTGDLKMNILSLKMNFKYLIAQPILSPHYRNLKSEYESKTLKLKSLLESTKKTSSGEQLDALVKLENVFQSQHDRIVELYGKLESDQVKLNKLKVEITITKLKEEKLDEAVGAFMAVTDDDIQIEQLLNSVYENGDKFEILYFFVARLPPHSRINGYKTLYDQLKKRNEIDHRIWILAHAIHQITEQDGSLIETVMADVKAIVREKNFAGLTEFLNKHGFGGLEAIKLFAPAFVQTVYENTDVKTFLDIIDNFAFVRHQLFFVNELIAMLKQTNRMHGKDMSLIVFKLIKLRTVKSPQNALWQKVAEHNLPVPLQDLMYNNLCIQNAENEEYLFASEPVNKNQRHVYTTKTRSLNESFYWQVRFTDDGTKIGIKNSKYDEHVFLIDEGKKEDEHVLRSWMGDESSMVTDSKAEFYLDMLSNGQFLIVNKHFEQMLYSPFDGESSATNNRPVFSKKYVPNDADIGSKWIIGLCRLDVEYVF